VPLEMWESLLRGSVALSKRGKRRIGVRRNMAQPNYVTVIDAYSKDSLLQSNSRYENLQLRHFESSLVIVSLLPS
jgi:hypothetical protein